MQSNSYGKCLQHYILDSMITIYQYTKTISIVLLGEGWKQQKADYNKHETIEHYYSGSTSMILFNFIAAEQLLDQFTDIQLQHVYYPEKS